MSPRKSVNVSLEWECIVDLRPVLRHNWHWCNHSNLVPVEHACHHLSDREETHTWRKFSTVISYKAKHLESDSRIDWCLAKQCHSSSPTFEHRDHWRVSKSNAWTIERQTIFEQERKRTRNTVFQPLVRSMLSNSSSMWDFICEFIYNEKKRRTVIDRRLCVKDDR